MCKSTKNVLAGSSLSKISPAKFAVQCKFGGRLMARRFPGLFLRGSRSIRMAERKPAVGARPRPLFIFSGKAQMRGQSKEFGGIASFFGKAKPSAKGASALSNITALNRAIWSSEAVRHITSRSCRLPPAGWDVGFAAAPKHGR